MKNKICLVSSSGGHLAQLTNFFDLSHVEKYNVFIVTEKNFIVNKNVENIRGYYLIQQQRKKLMFPLIFTWNIFKSLLIVIKERPNVVISTGAGITIPVILFAKFFRSKIVYIESFAKVDSPTISGRIAYKFSDKFYIQWEKLYKYYPNAIYKGKLY